MMKKRLYLIDALFVAILLSAMMWDLFTRGSASTHGLWFAVGIMSVTCLAMGDRLSAGIWSGSFLASLVLLIVLSMCALTGEGPWPKIVVFFTVILAALLFSVRVFIRTDRIQGACVLGLTIWALAIGTIAACLIIGTLCVISIPFLMRCKSVRQKYATMSELNLTHANVKAERMWKMCMAIAFLGPIPLCFFHQGKTFTCLIILLVTGSLATFWLWWSIETITKSELERKQNITDKAALPNSSKIAGNARLLTFTLIFKKMNYRLLAINVLILGVGTVLVEILYWRMMGYSWWAPGKLLRLKEPFDFFDSWTQIYVYIPFFLLYLATITVSHRRPRWSWLSYFTSVCIVVVWMILLYVTMLQAAW